MSQVRNRLFLLSPSSSSSSSLSSSIGCSPSTSVSSFFPTPPPQRSLRTLSSSLLPSTNHSSDSSFSSSSLSLSYSSSFSIFSSSQFSSHPFRFFSSLHSQSGDVPAPPTNGLVIASTLWGYPSLLAPPSWRVAQSLYERHKAIERRIENAMMGEGGGDESEGGKKKPVYVEKLSHHELSVLHKQIRTLHKAASLVSEIEEKRAEYRSLQQLALEAGAAVNNTSSSLADRESAFELKTMTITERDECLASLHQLEEALMARLLPSAADDDRGAIIEVKGAAGGEESSLFASELFEMYRMYAEWKGWQWEFMESSVTESGGFRSASALIRGEGAFGVLRHEGGVHRVQRIPKTEQKGRIHTSTVAVAVLPEVEAVDIELNEGDLRIETMRAQGKGGQHVNTTDSAVRITHLPTGVTVSIQDERSQHANKDKALRILRSRLYHQALERQKEAAGELRKAVMGSGERSEKIRTYNFPGDRVTDHRIGVTKSGVDRLMTQPEHLEDIIKQLMHKDRLQQLSEMDEFDAAHQLSKTEKK